MISIIVPCYNSTKYIDYAKKNFQQFQNKKFELIFVDDGSTDNTLEQLKKNFPFAKFYTQQNQGAGVARDTGISNANGEYIAFCDIDDYMHSDALEKIVSEMDDADIAIGQCYRTWLKGEKVKKSVLWKGKLFEKDSFYPSDFPYVYSDSIMMNKVYKTSFLKTSNCKFPKGKYEDKKYLFDLFKLNPKISIFNYHLYDWYVFENSTSQTNTKDLDDIIQRFDVCMYQINNSSGELKSFLIGNTISHDIVLYAKDYKKISVEAQEKIYAYYKTLDKIVDIVDPNFFTGRGQSLLKKTDFKQFSKQMLKLRRKAIIIDFINGKIGR